MAFRAVPRGKSPTAALAQFGIAVVAGKWSGGQQAKTRAVEF
jgi:hypothetical protein